MENVEKSSENYQQKAPILWIFVYNAFCFASLLSPRTTKLWRGYRVCPVRMYVSTYVRTYVRSYVHPL